MTSWISHQQTPNLRERRNHFRPSRLDLTRQSRRHGAANFLLALARRFFDADGMKRLPALPALMAVLLCLPAGGSHGESHRATNLGNPATRFAPPLSTPDDLRALFRNDALKPDIAAIINQWGWRGNLNDLFAAAATAEIADIKIPVGTTMPFMSSRKNGQPVCLRNVLWAGKEAAPAYAFHFTSHGRRYRCVTPKACSNFYLEDLGFEPRPALVLECNAPEKMAAGRPVKVCLTVANVGNAAEPLTRLTLSLPDGAEVISRTDQGVQLGGAVNWQIADLAPSHGKQVCAEIVLARPGSASFTTYATGQVAPRVQTTGCQTEIIGIPAILIEVVDLADPIEIGNEVTYEIKVTNQGTLPIENVRLTCALPESLEFVSGAGDTPVKAENRALAMDALASLAAKAVASWQVKARAARADDARFKVVLHADQFARPINEEESTQLY